MPGLELQSHLGNVGTIDLDQRQRGLESDFLAGDKNSGEALNTGTFENKKLNGHIRLAQLDIDAEEAEPVCETGNSCQSILSDSFHLSLLLA